MNPLLFLAVLLCSASAQQSPPSFNQTIRIDGVQNAARGFNITIEGNQNNVTGANVSVVGDDNQNKKGRAVSIEGNGNTNTGSNVTIIGNQNKNNGTDVQVQGNLNENTGEKNILKGDSHKVVGNENMVSDQIPTDLDSFSKLFGSSEIDSEILDFLKNSLIEQTDPPKPAKKSKRQLRREQQKLLVNSKPEIKQEPISILPTVHANPERQTKTQPEIEVPVELIIPNNVPPPVKKPQAVVTPVPEQKLLPPKRSIFIRKFTPFRGAEAKHISSSQIQSSSPIQKLKLPKSLYTGEIPQY